MRFHFHWYPAPRLLFFQVSRGPRAIYIRIGHTQWDFEWGPAPVPNDD